MYPDDIFSNPYWNVNDQKYWCKMNGYGYPVLRIQEHFRYIIENKKCSTFEADYQAWLESTKLNMQQPEA
jgi:hypothetical protein